MKILFLIDNLGSGGAQRQLTTIAPKLQEKGHPVEVLCYGLGDFFLSPLIKKGIRVHYIEAHNPILRMFKIRRFIRTHSFDSVVSFLSTPDFLNCFAAIGKHNWRVITSERSGFEQNFKGLKNKIYCSSRSLCDKVICNSFAASKMWERHYPSYRPRLSVIYNSVSIPEVTSKYEIRRGGKTHIVVSASYQSIKNPTGLIEAVHLLSDIEKTKLRIEWYGKRSVTHGGTKYFIEAQRLVGFYNLEDTIKLNARTQKMSEVMHRADVVALVSQYEGLPNSICEAMSLSKPILMSKVSDYDKLVDPFNGYLCEWDNPQSIADALSKLIALSDERLLEMGRNSKLKASTLFCEEKITQQWIEAIQKT